MPPKRKQSSQTAANSQFAVEDDAVSSQAKRQRAVQPFDSEPLPLADTELGGQTRRSSRAGKGNGRQLQQLKNLERLQTAKHSRLSRRNLDMATQGQKVNPMAPDHCPDDDEPSQIPPWALQSALPSPMQGSRIQPTFTLSQAGQSFGFRFPSQATTSTSGTQSIGSHSSSFPSSHSSSVFLPPVSHRGSTAPTSRATSECGSNNGYGTADMDGLPPRRSSHLRMLAAAANHSSDAPPQNSRVRLLSDQPSALLTQVPRSTHDDNSHSPPPRSVGLRWTQTFAQLPSTISKPHTMFATDYDGIDQDEDSGQPFDERSQNSADEITGSAVHNPIGDAGHGSQLEEEYSVQPVSTQREIEDVVAGHRQRNRGPRLPDNAQLLAIRNQQTSEASRSAHCTAIDDVDDLETLISACLRPPPTSQASLADVSPSPTQSKPAATSVASGVMPEGNSNPSQLQFYTPPVRDIIECAKQISHCDIASVNSFPLCVDFNCKATEYMNEAIAERRSRGLLIPQGWWPEYTSGITKLLWEDLGNWRSALKKKARTYVRECYEWDAQNRRHVNANTARKLLERGNFLKHGLDEEGHTNNLAHPALSGLIIDFFYTGANAMANIFPEVFQNEVPRATVALAATAIKVALDEVVSEGKEVTFKRDVYSDIYIDILGLMAKCDTAPVHRAKTKVLRVQWAKIGRNGSSAGTTTGFDVDLD